MKKYFLILLLLSAPNVFGQACCTAGTPLLSSLETSGTPFQSLQFGLSYRYNSIASIFINDSQLDDDSRERISKSLILQVDYGIWRDVSITALFSYILQERIILSPLGTENLLDTKGIGDALLLLKYNIIQAIPAGIKKGWETTQSYLKSLKMLLSPKKYEAHKSLGGFIKIASFFPPTWDWYHFWNFTAFLSIMLAIMNLLPIPALDGGHVMFLLYEMISGRKPGDKFMEYAQIVGMVLLLSLLVYANMNDVIGIFKH